MGRRKRGLGRINSFSLGEHREQFPGWEQQGGNTFLPINRIWIKDLLSMALPIRTRPSFPHSQSLSSGRFHKLLILIPQRENESDVAQSCPTLCDPVDYSLPDSSVHGIFHAIVLEWIAISFSSGSSRPRDQTRVSHIVDRRFTV